MKNKNIKKLYLTPKCKIQLKEALEFVAKYSTNKAKIMYNKFFEIKKLIEIFPEIGTKFKNSIRRFPLSKFPYFIYYREKENTIEILGIWHTSRGSEFEE